MDTNMSKIIAIHRNPESLPDQIGPRQLAIEAGNVTMIVEFVYLVLDSRQGLKGRELKNFMSKFESLERHELLDALQVSEKEFMAILNQNILCIGCRRIIERVFRQFKRDGSRTLEPITITEDGTIRIRQELLDDNSLDLSKLLQKSVYLFSGLLTYKQRSRPSIRCTIHNLDAYKVTPAFSETWTQLWLSMKGQCREKILIVEIEDLQSTLDVYLKKHKFCHECSAKVETAFNLLFKEKNPKKEPGYSEELYAGIKRCLNKHIQLPCKVDFIDMLIRRAEPELVGNGNRQRERHAKTLEIAQQEVLTCIGMCIFERFRRMYNARKEEEGACQLLAVLALHGMYRSFDLAVERKRGISNLELLYEEISQQEQRQEAKKEQKRLKKRQKKMEKRSLCSDCKKSHGKATIPESPQPDTLEDEEEVPDEDDDNEFEEEMIKVVTRSKSEKQQKSQTKTKSKQAKKQNNNSKKQKAASVPVAPVREDQDEDEEEVILHCHDDDEEEEEEEDASNICCPTCDVGYVSDQLSLTNCSSASSSSLEEGGLMKIKCRGSVDLEEHDERARKSPGCSDSIVCSASSPLTINSQLSSLSSSPEGSEVACQEGLCNHSRDIQANNHQDEDDDEEAEIHEQQLKKVESPQVDYALGSNSYIPEEAINEFRLRHSNLKEVREALRRNLRDSFAKFCLENKNRPLSHLCRTGRCQEQREGMCAGECE